MHVAVTDHPFPDLETTRAVLEGLDVELHEHQCTTAAEVSAVCFEADAVLNTYAPVPAQAIADMKRCRVIARFGIGVDTIDLAAAAARGIAVTNVPDYCVDEVATHTVALLLSQHRRIVSAAAALREGRWSAGGSGPIHRLAGQTLALVGAGRIPRVVAARASGLGLRVTAYDPYVADADWPEGIERRATLAGLATDADFLSVHAPLTAETRHLVDAALLSVLPAHAVLINTARGGLVDTDAVGRALRCDRLAGAALDVFEEEPLAPGAAILTAPNALLTPHQAYYSVESLAELQRKAAQQVRAVLEGKTPAYLLSGDTVDPDHG